MTRNRPRLVAETVAGLPEDRRDFDFEAAAEELFQDGDVLMLFDQILDGIEDSGNEANQALGMVDLAPVDWFIAFDAAFARDPGRLPPPLSAPAREDREWSQLVSRVPDLGLGTPQDAGLRSDGLPPMGQADPGGDVKPLPVTEGPAGSDGLGRVPSDPVPRPATTAPSRP